MGQDQVDQPTSPVSKGKTGIIMSILFWIVIGLIPVIAMLMNGPFSCKTRRLDHHTKDWNKYADVLEKGDMDGFNALIEQGADVNASTFAFGSVLDRAIYYFREDAVRILIAHGANVNYRQQVNATPLHSAAWRGQARVVRMLLEAGADPKAISDWGEIPLDDAYDGRIEMPQWLRENYKYTNISELEAEIGRRIAEFDETIALLGGVPFNEYVAIDPNSL